MKVNGGLQNQYFPPFRGRELKFSKYDIREYRQKVLYFTSVNTLHTSLYFIDITEFRFPNVN